MAEKTQQKGQVSDKDNQTQLDAAEKSLSDALRISFVILKIIMIILVILFLVSGFRTIESGQKALVLRFGKIRGSGEDRLLGPGLVGPLPGLHSVFPYPIDTIVKIPVSQKMNLPVNSFWYYQRPEEMVPREVETRRFIEPTLDPEIDGYCITRSEDKSQALTGFIDSDYNIVHSKWQLTYQIDDPERFFRNVYVDLKDQQAGQNYADVITKNITPLLSHIFDDVVVTAMVNYTIDEAMFEKVAAVTQHVKKLMQTKLNDIDSGIKVVSVQLTDITWPRQVDEAFLESIKSRQTSQTEISEAKTYAENTLSEAAGSVEVAEKLLATTLNNQTPDQQQQDLLWTQLAGTAQEKIAQARAYRTRVVESAKANAEYLQQILPQYRQRPELVIQKIYQDAIEDVYNNADEIVIVQPAQGTKGREIRIKTNRNPAIKSKSEKEEK